MDVDQGQLSAITDIAIIIIGLAILASRTKTYIRDKDMSMTETVSNFKMALMGFIGLGGGGAAWSSPDFVLSFAGTIIGAVSVSFLVATFFDNRRHKIFMREQAKITQRQTEERNRQAKRANDIQESKLKSGVS